MSGELIQKPIQEAPKFRRTVHMSVDIAGVLRWSDKELVGMFKDSNGNRQSGAYVRDWLKLQLALGKRVLPMGEREGFSFVNGCPGHDIPVENKEGIKC